MTAPSTMIVRRTVRRAWAGFLTACTIAAGTTIANSAVAGAAMPTKGKPAIPKGATYVALGSSYAAGSGIPTQLDACGHSDRNYAHLLAAKYGLQLVDASCGGAVTANLLDTPQGDHPPQLDALTPDTRLVTLTVGGNDVGYVPTAAACGATDAPDCTRDPAELDRQFAALETQFDTIYATIRERSPKATIVISAYPRLVTDAQCAALPYTPAEVAVMGGLAQRLQDVTVAAAKRNKVLVADPYSVGADHGPCAAPDQAWMSGNAGIGTNVNSYHPTAAGHVESAALIEKALAGRAKRSS